VISLKKYLEMEIKEPHVSEPDPVELLPVCVESYRSSLQAMGESGAIACPAVGADLQQSLTELAERLTGNLSTTMLAETGIQVGEKLRQWGDRTAEHFKAKTGEVKELLLTLAQTASSVGERDVEYSSHFKQLTTRLKNISNLEDLTQVRASLVQQAAELKTYVDKMEQNSQKMVEKLKTEVSTYETKLKQAEELALRDSLTGLANRRYAEERIEGRISVGKPFCIVVIDVNGLKSVNDKHGHLAGDNLLQQFAQELRSSSRASDLVGRWGGDEFIIVMDGETAGAQVQIERIKKWVFGDYTIRPGKGTGEVKVTVDAATGLAEWKPGETLKAVVERADAEMYKEKGRSRRG